VIRRALVALALASLAACERGSAGPSLRLAQPSAVAVFSGYAPRHGVLWPYAAVANSAQDELILFDAVDDKVVSAPIVLRPLSVPVGAPRPALLAAASFAPPGVEEERPSLLVVATAGSSQLQLVRTWHAAGCEPACPTGPGLADEEPIELGSEILALVAAPAVDAGGAVLPDRVRVVAALAGDAIAAPRIAVVEYQWTGDPVTGSAESVGGAPVATQEVEFQGLSLAVDPRDPRFAYAASVDPIVGGVFGVAQIDLRGSPPPLTVAAIDAKAPTRLVAAFTLRERALDRRGAYDQYAQTPAAELEQAFRPDASARVYAWRDPGACGPKTEVACGVAVLDPAALDVLEDPWNPGQTPKRYLPPITLPSRPVAMIVGPPAAHPPSSDNVRPPGDDRTVPARFMSLDPNTPRVTTGVLLLPSADGRNYFADLARWETPSSAFELAQGSGTGVSSFRPSSSALPRIGFYPRASGLAWDPTINAATYLQLTPGFTPTDDWTVTFQGYLPDFASSRVVQVESREDDPSLEVGALRLAFQYVPPGTTTRTQVVNVYDPAYGVRVGDIVEFWTDGRSDSDTPECPDTTSTSGSPAAPIEGKIVAISRPDGAHPGGSLVVQKGDCVPWARGSVTECLDEERGPWTSIEDGECWNLLRNRPRQARIRAGSGAPGAEEFVVVGAATGYAGRAVSSPDTPASSPTFAFSNEDEAALVAACTLIPYPSNPGSVPACEGACRTACEQAAIARRARRLHLTSIYCTQAASGAYCRERFPAFERPGDDAAPFPPPEGPALAFSLGWKPLPGAPEQLLTRDTRVSFRTRSGRVPASRWGGGGGDGPATLPTGGAYFDRTAKMAWDKADERYRFFVPYVGNLVLDLSPARENDETRVLR
jgi:hypothetical protein